MNYTANQMRRVDCFRRALVVGLGAQLVVAPALWAEDTSTNAPSELKKMVVVGSYIPTADTVTAQPVDTVSATQIQRAGTTDILLSLKALNPGFSGNGNIGQTVNNGGYGEANIALRNLPTLVLLDGQRLVNSALSQGAAVDLNTLPLAMVDRIDILKDGGSALYGSDAIGGVVNIVTKQNFNGAEAGLHYGFATDQGTYNEVRAYANMGYADETTKLTAGISYYYSDPLYTKDRSVGSLSAAQLQAAGLNAPGYYSPTYPGRVDSYILAGSPLAKGAPGYNPAITTPPVFAGQTFTSVSAYNTYAISQGVNGAYGPYLPISSTPTSQSLSGSTAIFNTTDLNTISIQRQDRRNFLSNFEQKLFENATLYGQFLYSKNDSLGQLAPAPLTALGSSNLGVPANNPYNPFGIDLGNVGENGSASPRIRTRLIETGNRQFESTTEFIHIVGGVKGDVFENYHYDFNVDYNRTTQAQSLLSADASKLQLALTPLNGSTTLSQLSDAQGPVPIYNYFGLPGSNSSRTIAAILASGQQSGESELYTINGVINGEVFDLPWNSKPFSLAIGTQYLDESISVAYDALSTSGNLLGFNAENTFGGGSRHRTSGFTEAGIPLISKEMNVPGIYSFEITAAGRVERVEAANLLDSSAPDIVHNSVVPKVGFRWQPFDDQLTIRGTYSQSFIVPTLYSLYGPETQNVPLISIFDPVLGKNVSQQETVNQLSNPFLPPSTSDNKTLGIVFTPKAIPGLTVSADFYMIEQDNIGYLANAAAIVADLNKNGANSTWVNNPLLFGNPVYVDTKGNPYIPNPANPSTWITHANFGTLTVPSLPGASQRTEGIDLTASYLWKTETAGVVNFFANANLLLYYQFRTDQNAQWVDYGGQYTDASSLGVPSQGALPNFTVNTGFTWSYLNFDYTVIAHYIPGLNDLGDTMPLVGNSTDSFTQNGQVWHVPSYYKLDMQLAYSFRSDSGKKWFDNTRVAIGCNNVTDQLPPLISSAFEDNTDKSTYDIVGRFVYVELSKKF